MSTPYFVPPLAKKWGYKNFAQSPWRRRHAHRALSGASSLFVAADGDGVVRQMATPFGRTPLHIACANDHDRVVNLLLAFHYDPLALDGASQSPVTVAQRFEAGLCSLLIRRHQERCKQRRQKDFAERRLNEDEWFERASESR